MTGEEEKVHRNGSILLVGLKIFDSSSRELLTWTLAKFTQAGDHVIAIHAPTPSSQAGLKRTKSEIVIQQEECSLGDSLIAAYESFCRIKQVDLQLKVARGASLRECLVEECKKRKASKLILGHVPHKLHTGHSFSLAKYCSRRLPSTCSVIVIEHGQITFEKEGSLRSSSFGDSRSGVLDTIQRTLRNRSWKNSNHQLSEEQKTSIPSKSFELEIGPDEYANAPCAWRLPSRFFESPVSVLHFHKHSSFHKKGVGSQDSPLSVSGYLGEQDRTQNQAVANLIGNGSVESDQKKVVHSRHSLEECFALAENYYGNDLYSNHASAKATLPHSVNVVSPKSGARKDISSYTPHVSLDVQIEDTNSQENAADEGGNQPNIGWPLLCKQFTTTKQQSYKLAGPRRLSVVEWAMQLPDRPRESVNSEAEFLGIDCQTICTQVCSDILNPDQLRTEENPNVCEDDDLSQPKNDALRSRLAKLSAVRTCKEFQLKELQAATSNFDSEKLVGKGGCSQVYQGVISDDRKVAVKCLNAAPIDSEDDLAMEVEIMCSLQHNHIVRLIGYCLDGEHHMLVYNFASQGNLEQKLHGGKGKSVLPWESRYNIAVGVADAVHYLHDCFVRRIIHRDVKSSNILLSENLQPQLTDFGLAKWMPASSTQVTCSDVLGTFGYLAPEYFMFGKVSEKTDVYSFGVVLLELITGRRPIDNTRPKGEENLVAWARSLWEDESSAEKIVDPKLEGSYDIGQLKTMMIAAALCLRQSPHMRPRMSRVLKLLRGEVEDVEQIRRQDSVCKESDDGYDMPNYDDIDIRTHLNLALFGLDDDVASLASTEHSVNLAHSNKYLEEYLGGRYSRSNSFE